MCQFRIVWVTAHAHYMKHSDFFVCGVGALFFFPRIYYLTIILGNIIFGPFGYSFAVWFSGFYRIVGQGLRVNYGLLENWQETFFVGYNILGKKGFFIFSLKSRVFEILRALGDVEVEVRSLISVVNFKIKVYWASAEVGKATFLTLDSFPRPIHYSTVIQIKLLFLANRP